MSELPKTIHRYEIVDRLGRGGMGELYLGKDPLLDRFVAIKVLRAGFEADDLRERFAREAKSAARLQHVNIVTIYDVGEHAGMPYIAMEYVRGETMFHLIQRKADLPLAAKLQYIDELCAGLAHAHKSGIVHRDIKPANLMIGSDGALKILDFGIARLVDSSMTQAGMVMGTLNYMSPEQITGQPIDHRSDIFAVGAVFYELIAYQQAFPGGIDSGVLSRIMEGKFTPLERVTTRIDKSLARVIDRALAKNPADRYPDLTAMREELARVRQRMDPRVLDARAAIDGASETVSIEPPAPTPRTPRRGTNRDDIQRRRREELQGNLAAARDAIAAEKYDEAVAACERALILEPDNEDALALIERARAATEQQQVNQWITEARIEYDRGNFVRARDLVSFVLSLDARSTEARSLRGAIERAQRKTEIEEILRGGRVALAARDTVAAIAAVQQAQGLDPDDEGAAALRRDVEAYVEAERRRVEEERRRADAERRAREVIPEARRRFDRGDADAAIALLESFTPAHPDVTAALNELRTEARVMREREAERERKVAAELQQARAALASDDLILAAAAVARARGLSPAHQDVTAVGRAIDARRAELAAKKKAEEDAAQRQAVEARRKAEEDAQRRAEDERRRSEEEARRRAAEDDARRRAAEEEARRRAAEEDARRRADEERQRKAEDERRRKLDEDARRKDEARRQSATAIPTPPVVTPQPPAGGAASYETMVLPPSSGVRPPAPVPTPAPAPAPAPIREGSSGLSMGVIGAAAVLALVVIGGMVYWLSGDDAEPVTPTTTTTAPAPAPETPVTPPPTGTTPTANTPTALLVIDAAPWAEIVEIVGPSGRVNAPVQYTPLAIALPEGEYRITLRNPNDPQPRTVTTRLTSAGARAFAEFRPVDVDDYFRRSGS